MLDSILEQYPKEIPLKDGFKSVLRPLKPSDEGAFHDFFLEWPEGTVTPVAAQWREQIRF